MESRSTRAMLSLCRVPGVAASIFGPADIITPHLALTPGSRWERMTKPITDSPAAEESASHSLRKALGLRDLVPMQILLVVGVTWSGIAAHQGGTHVAFWLLSWAVPPSSAWPSA